MRYLITGGTGFIGSALCRRWLARGDDVAVVSRSPESVIGRISLPGQPGGEDGTAPASRLRAVGSAAELTEPVDAIVNLAGASIAGGPWTASRRKVLRKSRLGVTEQIVDDLRRREIRPKVLVSASAVGIYGDRGDHVLTESSDPGEGFLADLCREWEAAALAAQELGVQVCVPRFGLVLGASGGLLDVLRRVYKLGLGGRLGSGRQWMPWIHRDDLLDAIEFLISEPISGPVNLTAPQPVRQATFSRELASALERPAFWWIPAGALRLTLGEMASTVLSSERAVPERLEEAGFRFRHTELGPVLRALVG